MYMDVCSGYTVSSVIVGDWRRLYVAGAPRFKHKGKVILFELSDDSSVNIVQALNGEQVRVSFRSVPSSKYNRVNLKKTSSQCLYLVAVS